MNLASGLLNPGYMAFDGEDWPMMDSGRLLQVEERILCLKIANLSQLTLSFLADYKECR